MNEKGVFIVLEGTDGSGKGTQFEKLTERLRAEGYDIATFDFPQYEQPSSYFIREYLNGNYGTAEEVGPYTGSLFFSLDRYQAAPAIRQALADGKIVIANRFTGSNMAHQGTKFANAEERRGYFIWLDNLEFGMLGIPRPDYNYVLRVPADVAQSLVDQKEKRSYTDKKRDIHEADLGHLQRAVETYDDLCNLFPKDFTRIDCVRGGKLLSIDEVHKILWEKLSPQLPAPRPEAQVAPAAPRVAPQYALDDIYVPDTLDRSTRALFKNSVGQLLERRTALLDQLDGSPEEADEIGRALLPTAALVGERLVTKEFIEPPASESLARIADKELPPTHAEAHDTQFALVDYWPRNELDAVPAALYQYADSPLRVLAETMDGAGYELKAKALSAYAADTATPRIKKAGYVFDLLVDIDTLLALDSIPGLTISHQEITPRYGYDVPDLAVDLSDEFEACFDLSTQLFSQLQAAGYKAEACYATLLGHKVRALLAVDDTGLAQLQSDDLGSKVQLVADKIIEAIAEVHPILADSRQTKRLARA